MIDTSIIISIIVEILILIGIIGAAVWIWKKKNWSIFKKAAITITLAACLIIAFIVLFGFILVYSDQANYLSQGSNLGKINYDEVITNAKKSGYKVDEPTGANSIQEIRFAPVQHKRTGRTLR